MAGIFEQAGYDAMASTSRVTAPENPAAGLERGVNGTNYSPDDNYDGRTSIADAVKDTIKGKEPIDLYVNPIKAMRKNNPDKDIYASLLNYEFMN